AQDLRGSWGLYLTRNPESALKHTSARPRRPFSFVIPETARSQGFSPAHEPLFRAVIRDPGATCNALAAPGSRLCAAALRRDRLAGMTSNNASHQRPLVSRVSGDG